MAFSLGALSSGVGGTFMSWASSILFWLILISTLLIGGIIFLRLRKNRKFDKPVLELYDLSNAVYDEKGQIDLNKSTGIFDFKITKGGWFKNKFAINGLWDYGREWLFRLKDMTPVYDVSHNDYRKINGKNGLVVIRNPNDSKFAVPISKFYISKSSKVALATIAPIDLRNAASNSIEQIDTEMQSTWQKWAPLIILSAALVIGLFITLLNTQYGKHMADVASKTLLDIKSMTCSSVSSTAP